MRRDRLVSIVGSGGIGKTALATAFADGIAWVDLGRLRDGDLLPPYIARACGVMLREGQSDFDTLVRALRDTSMLVILDNVEHLLASVASTVHDLLARTQAPHVLTTSQAPLRIAGECVHRVAPLTLPPPGTAPGDAHLQRRHVVHGTRAPPTSAFSSRGPTPAPWSRFAGASTVFRLRSNWRRRACRCWAWPGSRRVSTTASCCCAPASATRPIASRAGGELAFVLFYSALLAEAWLAMGRPAEALALIERALGHAAGGQGFFLPELFRLRASAQKGSAARDDLVRAHDLPTRQGTTQLARRAIKDLERLDAGSD